MIKQAPIPLRKIRRERALSQEVVAQALGIQTTTYSKLERGIIQLTVERLYELAGVFGVTPEALLRYDRPTTPDSTAAFSDGQRMGGNITYIPVHAQAGFLDLHADPTNG